jgi:iron complex transport system ATP-binding protein
MSDQAAVLDVREVTITASTVRLVTGVSLAVNSGEIVGLLGANGAGKSSLLKACSGEIAMQTGTVLLHGKDIRSMTPAELAYRRAVVAQSSDLSFPFTAREVVLLGATVPGFQCESLRIGQIGRDALADVGIAHLASRPYPLLSGGERQRVQIARAFCQLAAARKWQTEPSLLLLDEPTSSLDLAHQRMILTRLRRFAEDGGAALAVLHDVNLAAAYCDRLVIMKGGRVLASGKPQDVVLSDVLSEAYGCRVDANRLPPEAIPFSLPVTGPAPPAAGRCF